VQAGTSRAMIERPTVDFDIVACPRYGDRLELIALIDDPKVIRRILRRLGLPTEVPAARPARPSTATGGANEAVV